MSEPPEQPHNPESGDPRHGHPHPGQHPQPGYQPPSRYQIPPAYPQDAPQGDYGQGAPQGGYGQDAPQGGYGQGAPQGGNWQGGYQPYPGEPTYPAPGEQSGYPASTPAGPPGIKVSLGARAWRRPDARAGVSIAVAGAALVLIGALVWTAGYYGSGIRIEVDDRSGRSTTTGEGRRFLGAGVFLVLVVLGYGLAIRRRGGPLASAGAVLGAISVPFAIGFVSLSLDDATRTGEPFSIDTVFLVSILLWVASYLFVPGMRGRSFLLTTGATTFTGYVAFKAASTEVLRGVSSTLSNDSVNTDSGTSTIATIGIVFGLAYYAIAALLDRSGRHGTATALAAAALYTTVLGIAAASVDLGVTKTGLVIVVIGALLALYGGYFGRRATTWFWSAAFVLGIVLIVADSSELDDYTVAGIVFMLIGVLVAGGAYALSSLWHEAPDIVEDEAPVPATR